MELSVDWDNDSSYTTTPLNAFSNTNVGADTQLLNITRELNKCDSALLDYTINAPNGFTLQP